MRSYWLHDGHVVCRHNFILDPICRAANIIHSHFPASRKVAHIQNLSLLLTPLCRIKVLPKIFQISILQILRNFTSLQKEKYSMSSFRSKQPAIIQQALVQQQPAIIQEAVFQQQPTISPTTTCSFYTAAAQQQVASIHQQSNN